MQPSVDRKRKKEERVAGRVYRLRKAYEKERNDAGYCMSMELREERNMLGKIGNL